MVYVGDEEISDCYCFWFVSCGYLIVAVLFFVGGMWIGWGDGGELIAGDGDGRGYVGSGCSVD